MKRPKPITAETAADIVIACRHAAGHETIHAAGTATGINKGSLYRVELKQRDPSVGSLRALLKALGWRLTLVAERDP